MYPECRHVLTSGSACNSPALATSHWCYFHSRLYQRQSQRQAARHAHRRPDGRFTALPAPAGSGTSEAPIDTIDYGLYVVGGDHPERPTLSTHGSASAETASLDLPPVEDTESIQLALIDVIQALAANQIDAKPFSQTM